MTVRRKKLTKPEVEELINELMAEAKITDQMLLDFAEKLNGGPFKIPPISMAAAKKAVLAEFGCSTVTQLRKNKAFNMSIAGETISLKTKADWMKLYRTWVAVPHSERNKTGPTCINGIDVLENFRPWHVFNLDMSTATKEKINSAFKSLAKIHHPDAGGDSRVFERLQKMRKTALDSIDLKEGTK